MPIRQPYSRFLVGLGGLPGPEPRTSVPQSYNRDPILNEDTHAEVHQEIYVRGFKESLQLQWDIASGIAPGVMSNTWFDVGVLRTTSGGYVVQINFQRPNRDDGEDSLGGGAKP